MSYLSIKFLLLAAVTLCLYYIVSSKYRWTVLLVSGLVFYAVNSRLLILVMAAAALTAYLCARFMDKNNEAAKQKRSELTDKNERKALKAATKAKNKKILICGTAVVLAGLAVLKYSGFLLGTANSIVGLFGSDFRLKTTSFILPLGISYYTLSLISYVTDVYRGTCKAEKNYFMLLLFTCYFPHIVEGPIANYSKLAPQFKEPEKIDYNKFIGAIELILFGLVKKMVFADRLGFISDEVFNNSDKYGGPAVIIGIVSYALYIYGDFSGCIDIVSGISELFGIKLEQNFRQPFFSKSIQDFWRRWHITLGTWLKNYVFYPVSLSGNVKKMTGFLQKKSKLPSYYSVTLPILWALLFVWLGNGIWHGASWKYVIYGLYYYVIIALGQLFEPLFEIIRGKVSEKALNAFCVLRTFLLICIGFTLFRADSIGSAIRVLGSIKTLTPLAELYYSVNYNLSLLDFAVILAAGIAILAVSVKKEKNTDIRKELEKKTKLRWALCTVMILAVVLFGIYGTYYTSKPFVYEQF